MFCFDFKLRKLGGGGLGFDLPPQEYKFDALSSDLTFMALIASPSASVHEDVTANVQLEEISRASRDRNT